MSKRSADGVELTTKMDDDVAVLGHQRPTVDDTNKRQKGEDGQMITATTTTNTTVSTRTPIGIYRLPLDCLVDLAESFLIKLDIRNLAITCQHILRSLAKCRIYEEMRLRMVIERLKRQSELFLVEGKLGGKIRPFFGKFTCVSVTFNDLIFAAQLPLLNDVHKLIIRGESTILAFPLNLKELIFERSLGQLSAMTLPNSIVKISCFSFKQRHNLTKVRWPTSLTELTNLSDTESMDGLVLPDTLRTLSFMEGFSSNLSTIHLPDSLTNLTLHVPTNQNLYQFPLPPSITELSLTLPDDHPSCQDYQFPSSLTRLELHLATRHDLILTQWHLAQSCTNIHIYLRDIPDQFVQENPPTHTTDLATNGPIQIVTTPALTKLSILKANDHRPLKFAPVLELSESNRLITVQLDTSFFSNIRSWPINANITCVKLRGTDTMFPTLWPRSMTELDLSSMYRLPLLSPLGKTEAPTIGEFDEKSLDDALMEDTDASTKAGLNTKSPTIADYDWPPHFIRINFPHYSSRNHACDFFNHLPPTLEHISFQSTLRGQAPPFSVLASKARILAPESRVKSGVSREVTIPKLKPSNLPNLKQVDLGASEAPFALLWTKQLPNRLVTFYEHTPRGMKYYRYSNAVVLSETFKTHTQMKQERQQEEDKFDRE